MRIAFSGAHRTGKSTLIEELRQALPDYEVVDEPYSLLAEEGHEFAEAPRLEDFELQLERSLEEIADSEGDCLFDRCPADFLAYLLTHQDSGGFDAGPWLSRVEEAMRRLDLIVFVPVESPDRVLSELEDDEWRLRVDEEIQDILLADRWDFGVDVIEVTGSPRERARQVLAYVTEQER